MFAHPLADIEVVSKAVHVKNASCYILEVSKVLDFFSELLSSSNLMIPC